MCIKKLESWEEIYATSLKNGFVYNFIYRIKSEVAFYLEKKQKPNDDGDENVGEKKRLRDKHGQTEIHI